MGPEGPGLPASSHVLKPRVSQLKILHGEAAVIAQLMGTATCNSANPGLEIPPPVNQLAASRCLHSGQTTAVVEFSPNVEMHPQPSASQVLFNVCRLQEPHAT